MQKALMARAVDQKEGLAAGRDLAGCAVVEVDRLGSGALDRRTEKEDRHQAGKVLLDDIDRGVIKANRPAKRGNDLPNELGRLQLGCDDPADLVEQVSLGELADE